MCAMQSMTMMVYETVFIPNNSLSGVEHRKINIIDKMTSCYYYTKFRGDCSDLTVRLCLSLPLSLYVCVRGGVGKECMFGEGMSV